MSQNLKDKLRQLKQKQQLIDVKEQEYKDKEEEEVEETPMQSDDEQETEGDFSTSEKPYFESKKEEVVNKIASLFEGLKSSRNIGTTSDGKKEDSSSQGLDFTKTVRTFVIRQLPHGFYEQEITKFFSQIGKVLNVRVPVSKKTGGRGNVAYVQMEDPEIAKLCIETFDYYLLNDRVIRLAPLQGENPLAIEKQIFRMKSQDSKNQKIEGEDKQLRAMKNLMKNLSSSDSSKIVKQKKKKQRDYQMKLRNRLQKKLESANKK